MAIPSFADLFQQQQNGYGPAGGLGMASGYPQGTGGAGWPGEQAAMPPAAAPTNGQGYLPAAPLPPPPGPPQGGGLGGIGDAIASRQNSLVGMGLGMMGGGWAGGARGYTAGAGIDERAMAAKMAAQQHAAALAQNEAHFQRQQALAEAPQIVKVKTLAGEKLMLRDPRDGSLRPYAGGVGGGSDAGGASAQQAVNEEGVIPSVLDTITREEGPQVAAAVKAMAEGRLPTGGFGALKQLQPLVAEYKPGFDARDYALHLQSEKAFQPGGKYAEKARAINQAAVHGNTLWDLSEKLGGTSILPSGAGGGALNQAYQTYQGSGGSATAQQYQSDLSEYNRLSAMLGKEMITAAATGSDVKAAREAGAALSSARTPAERRGALKGAFDFLEGAHGALDELRSTSRKANFKVAPLITPENQQTFEKIQGYRETAPAASGQTGAGTGAAPAQAQPGAARPPGPAAPGMKWQTNGTDWRQVPK